MCFLYDFVAHVTSPDLGDLTHLIKGRVIDYHDLGGGGLLRGGGRK